MTTARPSAGRLPSVGALLAGQVRYQMRLLANGRAAVAGVGLPVIFLVVSNSRHAHPGPAIIAGYAVFGLTLVAWNTYGVRLVAARETGVLKRWRATPLPPWCYFTGRVAATVAVAVAAAAATVAAGMTLYGTHLSVAGALGVLVAFALGACAWATTATALTAAIPTVEAASPTLMLTYFPTIIISGAFGSISEPHWLATLARYLPAQPLINAATTALRHTAGTPFLPVRDVIVLAAWALVGLGVAIRTFRWEPHRPGRPRAGRNPHHTSPDDTTLPGTGAGDRATATATTSLPRSSTPNHR